MKITLLVVAVVLGLALSACGPRGGLRQCVGSCVNVHLRAPSFPLGPCVEECAREYAPQLAEDAAA